MKKIVPIFLALFLIVGAVSLFAQDKLTVNLNTLKAMKMDGNNVSDESTGETVRNKEPFTRNYDNLPILFTELPANITSYRRVTIKAKYFNASGEEIKQADGNAMVTLFYDVKADLFTDGNPNLIIKEFNVGGGSSGISRDRGVAMRLNKPPAGILLQNSNANVKFIEITEITFHNG